MWGTITLGDLIDALKHLPRDHAVQFDFGGFGPGELDSYRGFYDHLALAFQDASPAVVSTVLKDCEAAVGRAFEGYKGGTYRMSLSTPVWVANWGASTSTAITGIRDTGYMAVIDTAHVEV